MSTYHLAAPGCEHDGRSYLLQDPETRKLPKKMMRGVFRFIREAETHPHRLPSIHRIPTAVVVAIKPIRVALRVRRDGSAYGGVVEAVAVGWAFFKAEARRGFTAMCVKMMFPGYNQYAGVPD